ncbi:uncharacterized protein CDAR_8591 [Caerostris darwini]|uniref:PDZ domain-containing protein n=1 Tax=Caerostris darwini TaxID=1538125 RepID=A0AAV4R463_9ARAC|nr:uncharacterized protein CDAR_8591 [Caerostris darwini]
MVIKQIQKGSLAERCGAFRIGDDILSINDTDVAVFSTSQANNLLRGFKKKPGKLVLVANTERLSRPRKDKYLLEEDMSIKSVSSFDTEVKDKQSRLPSNYLHTPYTKHTPYGSIESLYNKEIEKNVSLTEDYDYQMKTISMLHEIIQSVASMHEFLAFFR